MKTVYDIVSEVYTVLNGDIDTLGINGGIYLFNAPKDDKENIVIGVLNNPKDIVQNAIGNINIEVVGVNETQPDVARLRAISDPLIALIDDKYCFNHGTTVHIDIIEDKGFFEKQDQKGKYIQNFRVNLITL